MSFAPPLSPEEAEYYSKIEEKILKNAVKTAHRPGFAGALSSKSIFANPKKKNQPISPADFSFLACQGAKARKENGDNCITIPRRKKITAKSRKKFAKTL